MLVENYADTHTDDTLDITYSIVSAGTSIGPYRWRGAHYGTDAVANPLHNDIMVNLLDGRLWHYFDTDEGLTGWRQADSLAINTVRYVGVASNEAEADQLVAHYNTNVKVGLRVVYGVNLRTVTAYTEGSEEHTFYHAREYRPRTNPGFYQTGTAFPSNPIDRQLFEFNDDGSSLSDAYDFDGTTAITTASRGDVFKYMASNTRWIKQSESGSGGTTTGITQSAADARYLNESSNLSDVDNSATARSNIGATSYQTGTAFPTSPNNGDIFAFNDSATSLTNTYDFDGTTAITTASRGDVFKYVSSNTRWVKQTEAGTTSSGISQTDADARYLQESSNLSDLDSAATARSNLGATSYQTGTSFPASPNDGDVFEFNDDGSSLTDTYDYDGTTALTTASRGDVFKYSSTNTRWIRQSQAGTAGISQSDADDRYLNESSNLSDLTSASTARYQPWHKREPDTRICGIQDAGPKRGHIRHPDDKRREYEGGTTGPARE